MILRCRKSRYRKRWKSYLVITYFIFITVSVLICFMIYHNTVHIVRDQSETLNEVLLNQIKREINYDMAEIKNIAYRVGSDPRLRYLSYLRGPLTTDNRYDLFSFSESMKSLHSPRAMLMEDPVVLLSNSGLALYGGGYSHAEEYLRHRYSFSEEVDVRELLFGYTSGTLHPIPLTERLSTSRYIPYVQSLDYNNGESTANVMVLFREQTLAEHLAAMEQTMPGSRIYLYHEDRLIASSGENEAFFLENREQLEINGSTGIVGGGKYRISTMEAQFPAWHYIIAISIDSLLQHSNAIQYITLTAILAYVLSGSLIALLLAWLIYKPIHRMLKAVLPYRDNVRAETDISYLENALESIITQERDKTEKLNAQWPFVKNAYLGMLASGGLSPESQSFDHLMDKPAFLYPCFKVAFFFVASHSPSISIQAVLDARLPPHYLSFQIDGDTFAVIANLPEETEETGRRFNGIIEEIRRESAEQWGTVTASTGGTHRGLDDIRRSYLEAEEALEYRIIYGGNKTIFYEEICGRTSQYYYPLEKESELIRQVRAGMYVDVIAVFEEVFEENFHRRKLSYQMVCCLFYDIISTTVRLAEEYRREGNITQEAEQEAVRLLVECQTIDQLQSAIHSIYGTLCAASLQFKARETTRDRIREYIHTHYQDSGFSQTKAAEDLCLSPSYLSSLFKQYFGKKMIDYVNLLRLEKSKELLCTTDKPVSEIAGLVGCTNDTTLTRIFKKYAKVTPGAYRSMTREESMAAQA